MPDFLAMARKSMEHHGTMDENNEDEMETGDALGFFLESDLLHFFHHYATKKFEQMEVLKRQMVDDLVSILLDVTTMSRPCQRQPEWCRFNPFVPCETEMATAMTYCLSVVPNHSMPGAKKAFFMCDLSAAGDVSK